MMLSNTNGYFTDIKIKNQHLEQWEMTKEAVMEEALKNTCQMAPPLICTNDENKWRGSFMENGAFCLSKSDKVMGVRLSTNTKEYGAIHTFTSFMEMNDVIRKICSKTSVENFMDSIISSRGNYRTTEIFAKDYPDALVRLGKGTGNMIASNFFEKIPECYTDEE